MDGTLTPETAVALGGRTELLVGLILACTKELPVLLRATSWDADGKNRGRLLCESSVVVVGEGAESSRLEAMLRPTGTRLTTVSSVEQALELLPETDVLVLLDAAAASDARLDAESLRHLPSGASVVDATGFAALDGDGLADAVEQDRLSGAAVLLHADRPLADDHPLWSIPKVALIPVG
jgi:phosphoglycerate dehydrogenase-like enzyme